MSEVEIPLNTNTSPNQPWADYHDAVRELIPEYCYCAEVQCLALRAAKYAVEHSLEVETISGEFTELVEDCLGSMKKKISECGVAKNVCRNQHANLLPGLYSVSED